MRSWAPRAANCTWPEWVNDRDPSVSPSSYTRASAPGPVTSIGLRTVMERNASSVSFDWSGQAMPVPTMISFACTPEPVVVTVTLPAASMFSRDVTFNTALDAVGMQVPLAQTTPTVGAEEMTMAAEAGEAIEAISHAAAHLRVKIGIER